MKNNKFTIKKIPLKSLFLLFSNLITKDVEYIDIHAILDEEDRQDSLLISVHKDYVKNKLDPPPGINDDSKEILTEEDILNLLNND